jgi:rSAM/selenodomain-associated transferase 1
MARSRLKPLVIVMVRAPLPGKSKTRLSRQIGAIEALRFYRATTASVLRRLARDPRWQLVLAVTPDHHVHSRFWPADMTRLPQGPGGLSRRMRFLLSATRGRPIVLIGSDIPNIKSAHIADALRKITASNLVLGPADDGGYWLIAAHARPLRRAAFDNVRWSTEFAMADTIRSWGGAAALAAKLPDVDTLEDYLQWRRDVR